MNRVQRYNQRLLRNALRETRVITSLDVTARHHIRISSVTWDEYWRDCGRLAKELSQLKAAWTALIHGNFTEGLRPDFVRAYFLLLRECLSSYASGTIDSQVLRKVVAFETFRISGQCGGSVAGILSTRNPVYLLSKVANPHAPENPKYLPLICPSGDCSETAVFYHHYRRIPIVRANGTQLFVYPPVGGRYHASSYSLLGRLFQRLTPQTDPWVRERSQSLFAGVFAPLVAASAFRRLSLLDIACGSGMVTMTLCKKAFAAHRKSFDLTLVDIVHGNKAIANVFYRNLHVFDNVRFRRECVFNWLDNYRVDGQVHFDVALLLRVCDVFSRFSIQKLSHGEVNSLIRQGRTWRGVNAQVPRPESLIAGGRLDEIQHGIERFSFKGGSVFRQFSLSEYFRALHVIMGGECSRKEMSIYFPVRTFDSDTLVLPSGRSLVDRLTSIADQLVIEDVDLSTNHLQRHFDAFGLDDVSAVNVTSRTKMQGAVVHLIARRTSRW